MNTLSDALTIGMVLTLVFGALCFYLYSRITQMEKRIGLTENILLDLKMATENTLMSMSQQDFPDQYQRIEPISEPTPIEKEEVENISDEDFYKSVLQQASQEVPLVPVTTAGSSVEVNYEAMSLKELKAAAKERNIHITKDMNKKDFILALKRNDSGLPQQAKISEPLAGSEGSNGKPEEGFPVDLGQNANHED
jgi:hypothetical protein